MDSLKRAEPVFCSANKYAVILVVLDKDWPTNYYEKERT